MESAGDVHAGKAWRPVRRPSDMVSSRVILAPSSNLTGVPERILKTDQRISGSGEARESTRKSVRQR